MIFPYILFTCFLVALYLTVKQCKKETLKYPENRLSLLLSLSSTIWSFGFWMLNLQTQPERAQIFRVIGMVGVLGYLIMAQLFVCYLSGTLQAYRYPITCISFIGLVIYFFIVKEEQVTFEVHRIGMTYHLNRGFWSTVYTIFCIAVAFNILASIIYMFFHAQRKRIRALAKKLMLVESIIVFGMVLDATLPLFGGSAVLGSTIGQCVGILAVYRAVNFINRSHITVDNMSSYVYSSLTTPVLVFDENYKLCLFNDVACQFLGLPKENVDNISIASLFSAQIDEMYFLLRQRAKLVQGVDVSVKNLCYKFGDIRNLSFEIKCGGHLMILGENGAGKTTLLRILAGIYKAHSGSVLIDGKPLSDNPKYTIGYIPQSLDETQFDLSVEEVVSLGLDSHTKEKNKKIYNALERTSCLNLRGRNFSSLSGGEKQKVSLARCLCQNAKLLLLDEPTASLDYENKKMVVDILRSLTVSEIPTIIVVTHDRELTQMRGWQVLTMGGEK